MVDGADGADGADGGYVTPNDTTLRQERGEE